MARRAFAETLEDPVAEDRHEVPVHARATQRVVLDVVVGYARSGHGAGNSDAFEMRVDGDGQPEFVDCLPHRVVHRVAVRDACRSGQEDTDELVACAHSSNLGGGRLRVLRRYDEHPSKPWLFLEPAFEEELVVRGAELRSQLRVRKE